MYVTEERKISFSSSKNQLYRRLKIGTRIHMNAENQGDVRHDMPSSQGECQI